MKNKYVIGILSGCFVLTAIFLVCASQYVVNKVVPTYGKAPSISERSIHTVYRTNIVTINPSSAGTHEKLDFSNIDNFLSSLNDTVGLNNIDSLYEERLYDSSEKDIISVYKSSDSKVSVVVMPDGTISSCTFEDISDGQGEQLKESSEGTGYFLKNISNGFMLEPDISVT